MTHCLYVGGNGRCSNQYVFWDQGQAIEEIQNILPLAFGEVTAMRRRNCGAVSFQVVYQFPGHIVIAPSVAQFDWLHGHDG